MSKRGVDRDRQIDFGTHRQVHSVRDYDRVDDVLSNRLDVVFLLFLEDILAVVPPIIHSQGLPIVPISSVPISYPFATQPLQQRSSKIR